MELFVSLFFSFDHGIVCLSFPWSKEKKRQTNNAMVKRKEKTDKQYHGQKKRKDRQTIPWSVLFVCLYFSFDHDIICLSFLVTVVLFVCLFFSFDHGIGCLSLLLTMVFNTMVKRKEKKRQTNNTMVKRKAKTDKMVLFVCLYFSFDHCIVCLSLLFF
jgi:uncharacterized membrane protein (DUF485 family)